jgi:hypothetical protein
MPSATAEYGAMAMLSSEWEELLGLDRLARNPNQADKDESALAAVAVDLLRGDLGPPAQAEEILQTLAHQIGHRQPPARSPMGVFLAEVRKLRVSGFRYRSQTGAGTPSGQQRSPGQ